MEKAKNVETETKEEDSHRGLVRMASMGGSGHQAMFLVTGKYKPRIERDEKAEGFREFVRLATLAPSGHNAQPWLFRERDGKIVIEPDFNRALPECDPTHRELWISLGCCVGALNGKWTLEDEEKIIVEAGNPRSELLEKRRTFRGPHGGDAIQVPATSAKVYEKGSSEWDAIRAAVQDADKVQYQSNEFKDELVSWIRFNKAEVAATRDGLTYAVNQTPALPTWFGRLLAKWAFLTPNARVNEDLANLDTSSHLLVFSCPPDIPSWIQIGVDLMTFLLDAHVANVAVGYLNQCAEVDDVANNLEAKLGVKPALILRLGSLPSSGPDAKSPRRPLDDIILPTL